MTDGLIARAIDLILLPVAAIAAPVIAGYVILLLHTLAKRVGLQVSAEQELKVRNDVQNAILGIEELARARLKATGSPTEPETKRLDAIHVAASRLPGKDPAEVADLVNEELPKVRAALAPPSVT